MENIIMLIKTLIPTITPIVCILGIIIGISAYKTKKDNERQQALLKLCGLEEKQKEVEKILEK